MKIAEDEIGDSIKVQYCILLVDSVTLEIVVLLDKIYDGQSIL